MSSMCSTADCSGSYRADVLMEEVWVQLEGSRVVQNANDRFDATMTNHVTFSSPSDAAQGTKQLESDATIQACRCF